MSYTINEADWKVFRRLQPIAHERYCARVLVEAQAILLRQADSPVDRFHDISDLLHKHRKELVDLSDFRRSTAREIIGLLCSMDLWTADEVAEFGPETQNYVRLLDQIRQR